MSQLREAVFLWALSILCTAVLCAARHNETAPWIAQISFSKAFDEQFLQKYAPYALHHAGFHSPPNIGFGKHSVPKTPQLFDRVKERNRGLKLLRSHFGVNVADANGQPQSYLPDLERPFFFFHVPKTGGTSLRELLFRDFLLPLLPPNAPISGLTTTAAPSKAPSPSPSPSLRGADSSTATNNATASAALVSPPKTSFVDAVSKSQGAASRKAERHVARRALASAADTARVVPESSSSPSPSPSPSPSLSHTQTPSAAPTCAPTRYESARDPQGSVITPCYNCGCTCDLSAPAQTNQTACAVAFLGHFYPYEVMAELHRVNSGVRGPVACSRWADLHAPPSLLSSAKLTPKDEVFWQSLKRSLCVTVVRDPFSRAISGYYEFGFPLSNLTAREYIEKHGVKDFLFISSSYFNGQTAILGGERSSFEVNRNTLKHAKRLLEHCIVGVQEDMHNFALAISQLFAIPPTVRASLKRWNKMQDKIRGVSAKRLALDKKWFRDTVSPFLSLDVELWKYAQQLVRRQHELLLFADAVRNGWQPAPLWGTETATNSLDSSNLSTS